MKIFDLGQLSSGFPTKIVGIVGKLSEEILRVGDFGLRKIRPREAKKRTIESI